MPGEVITTELQLAKSCKKYKGIIFTDKDGSIINDDNDAECENIEVTGVTEQEINDKDTQYIQYNKDAQHMA